MVANPTSDEDLVKETVEKIKKRGSKEEYLKALKEFNEAYLTLASRNTKSTEALLTKLKEFSSQPQDYWKNFDSRDSTEKAKGSFEKDLSKEPFEKESKDNLSVELLLKDLLNESSNRINHLKQLKEKKLALLKSI